jgi:hypothetical protein
VLLFTGNNIGPKGDLASRSLQVRLEVERADPENRPFIHSDPVGWTEANRGLILRALYTIVLGNPNRAKDPETRFKGWWRLIGSAVEHAAGLAGTELRFRDLFLSQEEDDEEGSALVDALAALRAQSNWGDNGFQASDLARLLNDNSERGPSEIERSAVLREFLFPLTPPNQAISAISIGKRLRKHVGEPVSHGNLTLILREFKAKGGGGKGATEYRVEAKQGE